MQICTNKPYTGVKSVIQEHLPLVSVITPSYNQVRYIRETIESVRRQNYPRIEHIVVDGESTDGTVAILEEYSRAGGNFRYVSELDRGQSHAINKGLKMAKGEIIGWLNSDDTYQPGAITKGVQALMNHPNWAMVYGNAYTIDENSQITSTYYVAHADHQKLFHGCMICQPAVFMRKQVLDEVRGVDESLQFCMDYDLWIRISRSHEIGYSPHYLANARTHDACKTSTSWSTVGIREVIRTIAAHYSNISNTWLSTYLDFHREEGIFGLLECLSSREDSSLNEIAMNCYEDRWVPPRFSISLASSPQRPLDTVLVKGTIFSPHTTTSPPGYRFRCSIRVDSEAPKHFIVGPTFCLIIPVGKPRSRHEIEIFSSQYQILGNPPRNVSFLVDKVLALTGKQAECFRSIRHSPLLEKMSYQME